MDEGVFHAEPVGVDTAIAGVREKAGDVVRGGAAGLQG